MDKQERKTLHETLKIKNKQTKIKELSKLYQKNPDNLEIIYFILKNLGTYKEHRPKSKELMKLLKDNYNPSYVNFELGKMEEMDNNYEEAIKYFDESLFYSPSFSGAKLELAKCYKKTGKTYLAKDYLKDLTKANKDKAAYYELGIIYEEENRIEDARECYETALRLNEHDARTLFKLGMLEEKTGNITLAKYYFERGLYINPNDSFVLTELCKCERELGNLEKAKKYIDRAITIKPESVELLEKGLLLEKMEKFEEAYNTYKYCQTLEKNPLINLRLGLLLKQSKNLEEAKQELKDTLGSEHDAQVYYMLSEIYLKEGNIKEAQKCVENIEQAKNKKGIDPRNYNRVKNYIKHQNGETIDSDTFFKNQMTNYEENNTIEVSKKSFKEGTNIKSILEKTKDKLTEENYFNTVSAEDFYVVELDTPVYDENGNKNDKVLIMTIVNSDKIITIMPTYAKKVRLDLPKHKKAKQR